MFMFMGLLLMCSFLGGSFEQGDQETYVIKVYVDIYVDLYLLERKV